LHFPQSQAERAIQYTPRQGRKRGLSSPSSRYLSCMLSTMPSRMHSSFFSLLSAPCFHIRSDQDARAKTADDGAVALVETRWLVIYERGKDTSEIAEPDDHSEDNDSFHFSTCVSPSPGQDNRNSGEHARCGDDNSNITSPGGCSSCRP